MVLNHRQNYVDMYLSLCYMYDIVIKLVHVVHNNHSLHHLVTSVFFGDFCEIIQFLGIYGCQPYFLLGGHPNTYAIFLTNLLLKS